MPRLAALDVGDATVGVAVSDELCITANPVTTIRRSNSIKADLRAVEELLNELGVSKVIVGLPLDLKGEEGIQAAKVKDFTDRLIRRIRVPVILWDESLSTVDAETSLIQMDISRKKRKKVIDQMAAAVILQSYLESEEWKADSQ